MDEHGRWRQLLQSRPGRQHLRCRLVGSMDVDVWPAGTVELRCGSRHERFPTGRAVPRRLVELLLRGGLNEHGSSGPELLVEDQGRQLQLRIHPERHRALLDMLTRLTREEDHPDGPWHRRGRAHLRGLLFGAAIGAGLARGPSTHCVQRLIVVAQGLVAAAERSRRKGI